MFHRKLTDIFDIMVNIITFMKVMTGGSNIIPSTYIVFKHKKTVHTHEKQSKCVRKHSHFVFEEITVHQGNLRRLLLILDGVFMILMYVFTVYCVFLFSTI